MKNNKAQSNITIFIVGIIGLCFLGIAIYISIVTINNYLTYDEFCKNNTDLCYCDLFNGCTFRLSHSSSTSIINGVQINSSQSNNVKELCDLARKIKDKQMLFDAEC
jgi:hypothetical protein